MRSGPRAAPAAAAAAGSWSSRIRPAGPAIPALESRLCRGYLPACRSQASALRSASLPCRCRTALRPVTSDPAFHDHPCTRCWYARTVLRQLRAWGGSAICGPIAGGDRAGPGRGRDRGRRRRRDHAWHAAREHGLAAIPAEEREPLELEFRRDDVLRFTTGTSVWPTNNISERGVRPLKTQQKISGRLTSDDVTQNRLDIRGYIDTARKHGLGACEVLHQLMLGNPWLPPAQPISP
jgi:hypothetical protein